MKDKEIFTELSPEEVKELFEEDLKSTSGYSNMAFNQSRKTATKKIEV